MLWYTGRRLLQLIPVFFGATFLIYFMVFALPGDPVAALYGEKPPSPAVIAQVRAEFNLNKPFIVQYLIYIGHLFTGNLGTTFSGIPVKWHIFSTTVAEGAPTKDLILPAIVLATVSFAYIVRLTRSSVSETMNADFVRTATAKGLPRRRVIYVHILRNSLVPVVTYLGVDIGSLMVGAIVTEGIFNIQGVGGTVYKAIQLSEGPTVVSFVAVMVIIFMLANLLVDLLYALLDPRIRYAK